MSDVLNLQVLGTVQIKYSIVEPKDPNKYINKIHCFDFQVL